MAERPNSRDGLNGSFFGPYKLYNFDSATAEQERTPGLISSLDLGVFQA